MASSMDRLRQRSALAATIPDPGLVVVQLVYNELEGRDAVHGRGSELATGSIDSAPAGMWNTEVAGVSHRHRALQGEQWKPLQPIALRLEPDNAYDGNSVAVYDAAGREMVGHLPKNLALELRPILAAGGVLGGLTTWEWRHREPGERVGIRLLIGRQPLDVRIS